MANETKPARTSPSLPRMPDARDGIIPKVLINPTTDSHLAWSLLGEVDLSGTVDGKPILQAFCEANTKSAVFRAPLPAGELMPAKHGEPWPDPQHNNNKKWPPASMWIGAALIVNSPDPFGWKSEDGRDILDFVVAWNNDHLFNQLMRIEGAPSIKDLEQRSSGDPPTRPWLHALAAKSGSYIMLGELLDHGMDPNVVDHEGSAPLHAANDRQSFQALVDHGANLWTQDADGRLPVQAWVERAAHDTNNRGYELLRMVDGWCKAAALEDMDRARAAVNSVLFHCLKKKNTEIVSSICKHMDMPLLSWRCAESAVGALGTMAYQAIKSPTENNRNRLCARLGKLEMKDAEHCSYRDIPDIDLVFAALTCQTSLSRTGRLTRNSEEAFTGCLVDAGMDTEQAHARKWEAIARLSAQPNFSGTKINQTIGSALSNKALDVFRKMKLRNEGRQTPGAQTDREVMEMIEFPGRALELASSKLNSAAMELFLSSAGALLKEGHEDRNTSVIDHVIALTADIYVRSNKIPQANLTCLENLLGAGALPSGGGLDRLQTINAPQIRPLLAKMVSIRLADHTAATSTSPSSSAPRL